MALYLRRILASTLDLLFLLPLLLLLVVPASYLVQEEFLNWPLASLLFIIIALLLAFALYCPVLMRREKHNGQTWGKQLLKIRVCQESGLPYSYLTALWRQFFIIGLLFILLSLPLLFLPIIIDGLWPLGNKRRETLHDYLSRSKVVDQ